MERLWLMLAVLLWGGLHSLLASLGVKAALRRVIGPGMDRIYRLAYNLVALLTFLPVVQLMRSLPDSPLYTLPYPWVLLTTGLQVVALILLGMGFLQSDPWGFVGLRQLVGSPGPVVPLTVTGLYRLVRHPLYTGGLLLIWLSPVMTANLLTVNIALTVYILIGAWFEERKLVREFGEAYRIYQAAVPMLLPGLRLRQPARKNRIP